MANSLLAHLYTHIRGSQEDIATIALQYILSQSLELNTVFTKRMASCLNVELPSLQYSCQSTGKSKERPDMSGADSFGKEHILCEMKFYAGLTKNQPLTYIDRLKEEDGKGLVFVCPTARILSLWTKIKEICATRSVEKVDDFCVSVDGIRIAIVSWTEILELLHKTAASLAVECLSDISQLEGYCAQMDSDAFIPFTLEDLSVDVSKKAERYYEVIDKTIELLCDDETIETSLKGLKATAYRKGYTRSIYVDDFAITINYDRDLWKSNSSVECPFWFAVRNNEWTQTEEIQKVFSRYPDMNREDNLWNIKWLSLEPMTDSTLLEVCGDLKEQILDCLKKIKMEIQ